MKVRNGFVSNSSSSSFVLNKNKLTKDQILLIHNHWRCKIIPFASTDQWSIYEEDDKILGLTIIDNFDMYDYLQNVVKVPQNAFIESDYFPVKSDGEIEAERILREIKGENYED